MLAYIKKNRVFYFVVILFWSFMLLRQWDRLIYSTLYAEDGALFLSRSLTYGYTSVFMQYAGYLQVFPQLISLISYHLSICYYPIITLLFCSFIYSYTISLLVKPTYSWISSSQMVRFFISLSITFVPGTPEILGNLSNIHTVLFICVTFRLIAGFEERYSWLDYVLFLLTAFSAGEFFLILPIVLFRVYVISLKKLKPIHLAQHLLLLLIIIVSICENYLTSLQSGVLGNRHLLDYIRIFWIYSPSFLLTIVNRLFYLPFFGDLTVLFNQHSLIAVIVGIILLGLIGVALKKSNLFRNSYCLLVLIAILTQVFEILLTACVRPDAANTPFLGQLTSIDELWVRYMIFMMPLVVVFWSFFINSILTKLNYNLKSINLILILFALFTVMINIHRLGFKNFYGAVMDNKYYWSANANLIYNTIHFGIPSTFIVPTAPLGWTLNGTPLTIKHTN